MDDRVDEVLATLVRIQLYDVLIAEQATIILR